MGNEAVSDIALSDDVLGCIFVLLAQDPERIKNDWNWHSIAHVCRRWRTVALDTGAFWSNILCHSTSLPIINLQLSRSKDADLSLTCIQPIGVRSPVKFDEILSAIIVHEERITNICIKSKSYHWVTLPRFIHPFFRKLKTLHFEFLDENDTPLLMVDLRNILSSPNLRTLCLINIRLWLFSPDEIQPLNSLVDLTFNNVRFEWRHLHQIMRICPNLQNLSIESCSGHHATEYDNSHSDSTSQASIQLHSLRNLKIHGLSLYQAHLLSQNINLPASSNWDFKCSAPSSFSFKPGDDTIKFHRTKISSIFSRHPFPETLHIVLSDHAILFRTTSSLELGEDKDDSNMVTTEFVLEHTSLGFSYAEDERCSFFTRLIRDTFWRHTKNFHLQLKSLLSGEITSHKWVDLLSSFDNLSSLEILLPFVCPLQYNIELSAALEYVGDHDIMKPILENVSIRLAFYEKGFIKNLKSFLDSFRRRSAKISKLRIEYSEEFRSTIQSLQESLSEYAQEVKVECGI